MGIDYELVELKYPEDIYRIKTFLEDNKHGLIFNGNSIITDETIYELFHDIPKGINPNNRYVFGIINNGVLVGIIESIRDFPKIGSWILGLLIVNKNIAKDDSLNELYYLIETILKRYYVKEIKIGVLSKNRLALKFWNSLGYNKCGHIKSNRFVNDHENIILLCKIIL